MVVEGGLDACTRAVAHYTVDRPTWGAAVLLITHHGWRCDGDQVEDIPRSVPSKTCSYTRPSAESLSELTQRVRTFACPPSVKSTKE